MKGTGIIIFSAGLAVGVFGGWFFTKQKYREIAMQEIEDTRNYYHEKFGEVETREEALSNFEKSEAKRLSKFNQDKPDIMDYYKGKEIVETVSYGSAFKKEDDEEVKDPVQVEGPREDIQEPFTISPERFAAFGSGFDKITLTYYEGDETLLDEDEEPIDDVNRTVGFENLQKFGEYEDDVVYVRNEVLGNDYEIIRDARSYYHDILGEPIEED